MESIAIKSEVLHPGTLLNTVGQELRDFFEANALDINGLLKIGIDPASLDSKVKFSKQDIKNIGELTKINGIETYLKCFQKDYSVTLSKAENNYSRHKKIFNKVKHLAPLLKSDFNDGMDLLDDISSFLGIDNEEEIFDKVNENIALYRISNFEPDNLNLYAWLKRGELDFIKLSLPVYDVDAFQSWIDMKEWQAHLNDVGYLKSLPQRLQEFGVGLIFTPYLQKTVFGAVRWFNDRPLVQVSDKGECLATIWYSLFHEFGHVIKHRHDMIFEGEDSLNLPKSKINLKEKEANAFAYQYLFGGDGLRKRIFAYKGKLVEDSFIDEQSYRFNVNKMFVAYWMNKARIKNRRSHAYLPKVTFD
jgi:hypothetical protein